MALHTGTPAHAYARTRICAHTHTRICSCTHTRAPTPRCPLPCAYINTNTYACFHVHSCMHGQSSTHIHSSLTQRTHLWTHIRRRLRTHPGTLAFTHTLALKRRCRHMPMLKTEHSGIRKFVHASSILCTYTHFACTHPYTHMRAHSLAFTVACMHPRMCASHMQALRRVARMQTYTHTHVQPRTHISIFVHAHKIACPLTLVYRVISIYR